MTPERTTRVSERFGEIYRQNLGKGLESASGPGSSRRATAELRPQMIELIQRRGIRILVDAGCGDGAWIGPLIERLPLYAGYDVVPELVEALQASEAGYGGRAQFALADFTIDQLPRADMILCRDGLVQLSDELAVAALSRFVASRSRWLLATTFPDLEHNKIGSVGGWRPVDLTKPPFNLPAPAELLIERPAEAPHPVHGRKALGLWDLHALRDLLPVAETPPAVLMLRQPTGLAGAMADLELTPIDPDRQISGATPDDDGKPSGVDLWTGGEAWAVAPELTAPGEPGAYLVIDAASDAATPLEVQLLRRHPGDESGPFSWYSVHRGPLSRQSWVINLDWLFSVDGFAPLPGDRLILRFKSVTDAACGVHIGRLELMVGAAPGATPPELPADRS